MKSRERLTHERVLWIDQQVRAERFPNTRVIAELFEVSPRTAKRTLDFRRDRFKIQSDPFSNHSSTSPAQQHE
jgi:hypothetical protein